jgi:hypothetical protein
MNIEGRVADDFPAYRDPEAQVSIRAKEHRPTQPAPSLFFLDNLSKLAIRPPTHKERGDPG